MFLPTIKQVFQSRGIEFQLDFDKTIIMEAIMKIVPFEIRYTLRGNYHCKYFDEKKVKFC